MMTRIALFLLVTAALVTGVWWVLAPAAVLYIWLYRGFELFFLGLVVDGAMGQFYEWPYYATGLLCGILLINLVRPHLLLYNR